LACVPTKNETETGLLFGRRHTVWPGWPDRFDYHRDRNGELVLLLITKLDTLWIILGAALISLSVWSLGLIQQL
jgi:hypothetical protein